MSTKNFLSPCRGFCVLAMVLVLGLAAEALAQPRGFDPDRLRERLRAEADQLLEQLGLEADRVDTVRALLYENVDRRIAALREGRRNRQGRARRQEQMKALDEATEKALAGVLSEVELARYQTLRDEQRARRRPGGQGPRGF